MLLAAVVVGAIFFAAMSLMGTMGSEPQTKGQGGAPASQYQNEAYKVPAPDTAPPPLPMPKTYGDATRWMQQNAIYNESISVPVRCEAQALDLANATRAQLQTHFDNLTACLMRVFAPPMQAASFTAVRPTVTIYSGQVNSPCGTLPRRNAAYCSADQQVYYATDLPAIIPTELRSADFVVDSVVAHEFAHALQARTGILISQAAWAQQSTKPEALELSRRTEVQADCWAAQFLQSVGQSVGLQANDVQMIGQLFYSIGDDQLTGRPDVLGNHGTGTSRVAWYNTGISQQRMGACNSYTAPANQVR